MSAADRSGEDGTAADAVAAAVREADFVRILSRADGDAIAASGILARALDDAGTPFQVSVVSGADERSAVAADAPDDETTVSVGAAAGADVRLDDGATPASVTAWDAAAALDAGRVDDPVLPLVGAFAAGVPPGAGETAGVLERASEADLVARRPGVALPTEDLADGLAHSTLLSATFSADEDAARADLAELALPAELDDDAHRRIASLVAIDVTGAPGASERAADSVERALRPYETPESPFETIGGFADVLDCLASAAPGTGVALALGHDVRAGALDAWRDHARRAHADLRTATTERHDGLFVARVDDDETVATCARLARDFRSPEPVALAVADGAAALATTDERSMAVVADAIADAVDGTADGGTRRATLSADCGSQEIIAAATEAL